MARTFARGVHPHSRKEHIGALPIEAAPVPAEVVIPLHQNLGAPCESLVNVGDTVKVGQKIGDNTKAPLSAPVHSSVSGTVKAVEPRLIPDGRTVNCVVIENDGTDTWVDLVPAKPLDQLTPEEVIAAIREAGIVGMGGAGFPTAAKFNVPPGVKLEAVLINGAECETLLSGDHRLMVEKPEMVVTGLLAFMKAAKVTRGFIGIEVNKPDAIAALKKAAQGHPVEVVELRVKYPQGLETELIKSIMGREVPPGKLPMHVGAVVSNVGTAVAVAEALTTGKPLIERVVTVAGGAVSKPRNLMVRVGTSFRYLLDYCVLTTDIAKLISGGQMMGIAQSTADVPVTKTSGGIIALSPAEVAPAVEYPCVRCAKCVDACPVGLQPLVIAGYAMRKDYAMADKNFVMDCRECGCCTYVCPANRPLMTHIKMAKSKIMADRKAAQAKAKA